MSDFKEVKKSLQIAEVENVRSKNLKGKTWLASLKRYQKPISN